MCCAVLLVAMFCWLDVSDRLSTLDRLRLVAGFGGYRCGKLTVLVLLRGCRRFAGSSGGLSPMVSGVVDGWPVFVGVAKPAGVVGPAGFGALGLRLGLLVYALGH